MGEKVDKKTYYVVVFSLFITQVVLSIIIEDLTFVINYKSFIYYRYLELLLLSQKHLLVLYFPDYFSL